MQRTFAWMGLVSQAASDFVYSSNDAVRGKPFFLRVGHRQPPSPVAPTWKDSTARRLNNSQKQAPRTPPIKMFPPLPLRNKCSRHFDTAENSSNVQFGRRESREHVHFMKTYCITRRFPTMATPYNPSGKFYISIPQKGLTALLSDVSVFHFANCCSQDVCHPTSTTRTQRVRNSSKKYKVPHTMKESTSYIL